MDCINNEIMEEHKAKKRFIDLNSAMQQYFIVIGRQLEPLPPKPVLSDFMCHLKITTIVNSRLLHYRWLEQEPFCGTPISKNISYNYMSIYIGNDLEDRLEALEAENASSRKYNEYHQVVYEIDHMSDLHVDSSFHKQSIKLDNYAKIKEWLDSSVGQSTVIQQLDKKRPKLSNQSQTQNRRRYVNLENGSHLICSFNLNNPELKVFIVFKITDIAPGDKKLSIAS